jgi:transposase
VAEALDIHPFMLSRWRKEYREGLIVDNGKFDIETPAKITELYRLRQLEKEHAILKEEHALLKKAIRFCSERRQKSLPSSSRTGKNTK